MKARFKEQNKFLSITLADALSGFFSDDENDRSIMIEKWCILKNDSRKKDASTHTKVIPTSDTYSGNGIETVFDADSDYPSAFTKNDHPVPIQIGSGPNTYDRTGPSDPSCGTGLEFTWTDDQYRNVILGLRAVSLLYSY
jgi:hypothetical protein